MDSQEALRLVLTSQPDLARHYASAGVVRRGPRPPAGTLHPELKGPYAEQTGEGQWGFPVSDGPPPTPSTPRRRGPY